MNNTSETVVCKEQFDSDDKLISFKGELSSESKKFVLKKQKKAATIMSIIQGVIFSAIVTLLGIFLDPVLFFLFAVVACIPFLNVGLWVYDSKFITQIDFDNNIIYPSFEQKKDIERPYFVSIDVDAVKKVVDYGDFYHLIVFGKLSAYICQKDLITQGTIEDFEKLFEDKIVRKVKDK